MKILCIHSDFIEYETKKKAISNPDEIEKGKETGGMKECLVVFTAVEKIDEENKEGAVESLVQEIRKIAEQVGTRNIFLYPYAHLSPDLANPDVAKWVLKEAFVSIEKEGYSVGRAPFGWYKAFKLSCKGHPLSELSSQLSPGGVKKSEIKEKEVVSEALKAEEKLKSYWYIMDTEGNLVEIDRFDFSRQEKLKKFAFYETAKDRTVIKEPVHIPLMKKLELVDYEPASDSGNMRYYPKGRLVKKLLEEYVSNKIIEYGGVEVETPIMYDIKHPTLERYLNKFPARQYQIVSDKRTFFLRFAACFGQFLMAKDATISYKNLPLKLYELTRYSFRREQSGEVCGLRRLRAFTMPDVHALCRDFDQAIEQYKIRFELCMDVLKGVGITPENYEIGLRVTKEFFNDNKELIKGLVKKFGKPILVEMWDERKFYFVLKYEFNYVDSVDKAAALSTDQIDVENGERYGIRFTDKDGSKKYPLILHCSPSGAIERIIYALLEIQGERIKRGEVAQLPLWLSPTQVRIIPVSNDKHLQEAIKLSDEIFKQNIRVDVADEDDTISKRIRQAEKEWIPFIVVYGDKELGGGKIMVRVRGKKEPVEITKEELIKEIHKNTEGFPFKPLPLSRFTSKRPIFVSS